MRPTDLTDLDMRAVLEANLLCFDTQEGEFSGWINVAEVPRTACVGDNNNSGGGGNGDPVDDATARKLRRRLVFRRRFCRLRELMCAFYESDAPSSTPIDHHVIISVERVHERNKAFQFIDYEDRCVMLFTTLGADFEEWFSAFAYAVRKTQVSKSRIDGHDAAPQPPLSNKAKLSRHRSRKGTAVGAGYLSKASAQDSGYNEEDDELDECQHTAWLYLQCPWWKLHHRRRRSRRYFVLSGVVLSCFGVNKEGQLAEFTTRIASFKHDPAKDKLVVQVTCDSGKTLQLSQKASKARVMEEWVAHLRAALDSSNASSRGAS